MCEPCSACTISRRDFAGFSDIQPDVSCRDGDAIPETGLTIIRCLLKTYCLGPNLWECFWPLSSMKTSSLHLPTSIAKAQKPFCEWCVLEVAFHRKCMIPSRFFRNRTKSSWPHKRIPRPTWQNSFCYLLLFVCLRCLQRTHHNKLGMLFPSSQERYLVTYWYLILIYFSSKLKSMWFIQDLMLNTNFVNFVC